MGKTYHNGAYTFVKSLSSAGSFGQLEIVRDKAGNLFALKILDANYDPENKIDEDIRDDDKLIGIDPYILREITLLKHFQRNQDDFPGVLPTVDVFLIDPSLFVYGVILPYFPKDLRTRLHETKTKSLLQLKPLLSQMLTSLHSLHSHGILHRDLKPENFLLSSDEDKIVLIDFGLSKYISEPRFLIKSHDVCTLDYRSPELLCAVDKYGFELDIWAMGVVLFEFITGTVPWPASCHNHLNFVRREKLLLSTIFQSLGQIDPIPDDYVIPPLSPLLAAPFPKHSPEQVRHFLLSSSLKLHISDEKEFLLAVDFFQSIFVYGPKSKRANIEDLLKHKFITQF